MDPAPGRSPAFNPELKAFTLEGYSPTPSKASTYSGGGGSGGVNGSGASAPPARQLHGCDGRALIGVADLRCLLELFGPSALSELTARSGQLMADSVAKLDEALRDRRGALQELSVAQVCVYVCVCVCVCVCARARAHATRVLSCSSRQGTKRQGGCSAGAVCGARVCACVHTPVWRGGSCRSCAWRREHNYTQSWQLCINMT